MLKVDLFQGDCLKNLRSIRSSSIDAIVTDPPYGISFMGKGWDYDVPKVEVWKECLRVLKPGGHALIACGTRTQHRMAVNIEDAGFEIRDVVTWLYGSGFPKSHNISKAIDETLGAERKVLRTESRWNEPSGLVGVGQGERTKIERKITKATTKEAQHWEGWGTALKPACEFFTLARKPLRKDNLAENVLIYGTGGINIDATRIGADKIKTNAKKKGNSFSSVGGGTGGGFNGCPESIHEGRWPANLMLDQEAAKVLDKQSGTLKTGGHSGKRSGLGFHGGNGTDSGSFIREPNQGGASRFFYVAKPSKSERNKGCEDLPDAILARSSGAQGGHEYSDDHIGLNKPTVMKNNHPTVKPVELMKYLIKLITPPGGTVLDLYMGSGTTGVAAVELGFNFTGIERSKSYFEICKARINNAQKSVKGNQCKTKSKQQPDQLPLCFKKSKSKKDSGPTGDQRRKPSRSSRQSKKKR